MYNSILISSLIIRVVFNERKHKRQNNFYITTIYVKQYNFLWGYESPFLLVVYKQKLRHQVDPLPGSDASTLIRNIGWPPYRFSFTPLSTRGRDSQESGRFSERTRTSVPNPVQESSFSSIRDVRSWKVNNNRVSFLLQCTVTFSVTS